MRLTALAKEVGIKVVDLKILLEEIGVPEEGRTNASTLSSDVVMQVRAKLSKSAGARIIEKGEHITELPSGRKVIILFSPIKRLAIALRGGTNVRFENFQMILDAEDRDEMKLYEIIMRIGPRDAFVVVNKPHEEHSIEQEEFERKLQGWLQETGEGSTGEPSVRGSLRIQALFDREEHEQIAKKVGGEVSARTLKMTAVNTKQLVPAKF